MDVVHLLDETFGRGRIVRGDEHGGRPHRAGHGRGDARGEAIVFAEILVCGGGEEVVGHATIGTDVQEASAGPDLVDAILLELVDEGGRTLAVLAAFRRAVIRVPLEVHRRARIGDGHDPRRYVAV